METVQTSVNIITLYPCWKTKTRRGEQEQQEGKPIQLCDVSVVCVAYIHFSNIRKVLSLRDSFSSSRVALSDVKTHSKFFETLARLAVYDSTRREGKTAAKNLCWKIYDVGVVFYVFLPFHMPPHLRHMFFVVFAQNIIFNLVLSLGACWHQRWDSLRVFRSIKYM